MPDWLEKLLYILVPLLISILVEVVSCLICYIKTKHQIWHQQTGTEDQHEDINLEDYYILIDGKYEALSEAQIVKKEETESDNEK